MGISDKIKDVTITTDAATILKQLFDLEDFSSRDNWMLVFIEDEFSIAI